MPGAMQAKAALAAIRNIHRRETDGNHSAGATSPGQIERRAMTNIIELEEQRAVLSERARVANEADDIESFDKAFAELETLNKQITRARKVAELDRMAPGTPVHGDAKLEGKIRSRFSLVRALAGAAGLPGVDWGFEREAQKELALRAGIAPKGVLIPTEIFEARTITTAAPVASPGGKLIATDFMAGEYINALTASTVVSGLGARTLAGLTGNVTIPGEKSAPSVAWVAEDSALTATDAAFRDVNLAPKHLGSLSEFSRNMLLQPSTGIEALLRQMMARDIALEIDRAAIAGAANGPTGLLATSGVQSETYADSIFHTAAEMIGKADTENVGASRRFLSTMGVKKLCLTATDKNNVPLPLAALFHGVEPTFSNQVPNNLGAGTNEHVLIYGDWTELLIGVWSALDVLVNPYESAAYKKGNVMVRSMATIDMAVRHPQAFVKCQFDPASAAAIVDPNV